MELGHKQFCLISDCEDRVGIVARTTGFFAEQGVSIAQANQYVESDDGRFFMRYLVSADAFVGDHTDFAQKFEPIAKEFQMNCRVVDATRLQRVVVMVSKHDHCLAHLLHRWKGGDIRCDIPGVISNHESLRDLVEWHGIPFHHVPVPSDEAGRQVAFEKTAELIDELTPDTIVLARYMQILPPWLCERYRHQVLNIHHSFLPSFAGAKPYSQAQERGVKLIGATCHYVTAELDAGPIIEQDVVRIHHSDSIADLKRYGKDVENLVLARGLRYHLENRVLVHGSKTILFDR